MAQEDENDRSRDRLLQERNQEALWRQQMRNDAVGLEARLIDPMLENPRRALPEIIGFLYNLSLAGRSVSSYEVEPLLRALMVRAQSGLVERARMGEVAELDAQLVSIQTRHSALQTALIKVDMFRLGIDETMEPLTPAEQSAYAEYSTAMGEREWLLRGATNGVSTLISEQVGTEREVRYMTAKTNQMEARMTDPLDPDELRRYRGRVRDGLKGLKTAEIRDFERLSKKDPADLSDAEVVILEELNERIEENLGDRGADYEFLRDKAGGLLPSEVVRLDEMKDAIAAKNLRLGSLRLEIAKKIEDNLKAKEWMRVYNAVSATISNINVTDQWRRGWHDLKSGAADTFLQTRWTEFQIPSQMVELCELAGVGVAMETAFAAIGKIAMNGGIKWVDPASEGKPKKDRAFSDNMLQKENVTAKDAKDLVENLTAYVMTTTGVSELYARFGVEQARMLFENSMLSGWFAVKRNKDGEIIYKWEEDESADFGSEPYKYGVPTKKGDGTLYGDRGAPDTIKVTGTRQKLMKDAANGYPIGLPALIAVAPDYIGKPWIGQADLVAIAGDKKKLADVFCGMKEAGRWDWMYPLFRASQVYDTYLSEFLVGLKGFRGIADEIDFFLQSYPNLAGMKKKMDLAMNLGCGDLLESQRLLANMVLAVINAAIPQFAIPEKTTDKRSVLTSSGQGKILLVSSWAKDDYSRIFTKWGFMTAEQFEYLWEVRLYPIIQNGGHPGIGMLKRGELVSKTMTMAEGIRRHRDTVPEKIPQEIPCDFWRTKDQLQEVSKRRRQEWVLDS